MDSFIDRILDFLNFNIPVPHFCSMVIEVKCALHQIFHDPESSAHLPLLRNLAQLKR
jgi:hypothetical protein